ncbi:enoyl-CoA hydratase/isomerase family protein [Paeniglutamicibacter sp. NPDC091659]|uniref:enoyl-CoA hydratase/isomerase family protein n=1 Tax=Paeniglutamicibacter sp. NPDC091659 TaxID=3364389 RepID=UPI0037F3B4A1
MAATECGQINLEVDGCIGRIVIDNPRQRNAMTRDMCISLAEAVQRADADPRVKVITLRGRGKDFSAGAAINELHQVLFDNGPDGQMIDRLSEADAALQSASKPTVALVEGICMGGGWQIASACDMSIAAETVKLAVTPSKLGIIYPRSGIERLVQRLGADKAKYVLFSADLIPAKKAADWGLLTETMPEAEFEESSQSLVLRIAERSQYSVHTMKALIDSMVAVDGRGSEALWDAEWAQLPDSEDFRVGQAAFLAGGQPNFTWSAL